MERNSRHFEFELSSKEVKMKRVQFSVLLVGVVCAFIVPAIQGAYVFNEGNTGVLTVNGDGAFLDGKRVYGASSSADYSSTLSAAALHCCWLLVAKLLVSMFQTG